MIAKGISRGGFLSILGLMLMFCAARSFALDSLSNAEGLALAKAVYDRPNGDDFSAFVVMKLQSSNGNPRQRELYSYGKEKGGGERWSLMRFIKPDDVRGTGLLTQDHPGDESDQWLYLPALKKVRRISSSRKGGRFVGSDFFYEDLLDREVEMDHHFLKGKGSVGKVPCDLLVSVPKDPDNSVYSKRVSCIYSKILVPLTVELFEKGQDKPSKKMTARKIKKIQGVWTILESTMYDLKTGHKTQLITQKIKYDQGLPDRLFTRRDLTDTSFEKRFRP
ncbi:MAG: outer membrane lipoprotein-sorting protein [Sedimenticola selenatireducens]|uniref:Outer membrane lipoprotein-sorting protein n=2 Tax=Sedimenticola selenatireducens TaxID=191960 RepID=A0A558DQY5_9GAMM|nr:outer membrane lipoprotein-sorting protein [Sedimenticola selenatireducens]TVO73485.1 outer membrane lipoprotein-sorting protein [Sedimenticola selenatireducens]TVT63426.1 MAG: outer membrane lipoprotein-sorting protein [Sedimenticola selenatireducens]